MMKSVKEPMLLIISLMIRHLYACLAHHTLFLMTDEMTNDTRKSRSLSLSPSRSLAGCPRSLRFNPFGRAQCGTINHPNEYRTNPAFVLILFETVDWRWIERELNFIILRAVWLIAALTMYAQTRKRLLGSAYAYRSLAPEQQTNETKIAHISLIEF